MSKPRPGRQTRAGRAFPLSHTYAQLWQLADEPGYGKKAGWFILVTPDGESEFKGGPWRTEAEAVAWAKRNKLHVLNDPSQSSLFQNPGDRMTRKELESLATSHAQMLVKKFGHARAAEIIARKVADAPFLVTSPTSSLAFWRMVAEARNRQETADYDDNPRKKKVKIPGGELWVDTWQERDRLAVHLYYGRRGDPSAGWEIASWWDDDVLDMIDSGFFKPGRKLEESVIAYALDMRLTDLHGMPPQ